MASVVKHFIARHGLAVGTTPTTVISDSGAATITNLSVSGSLQTALNLNSQILTNANIDSGTIDGVTIATSDVTVGSGKTLDVSAGTLTLANDQISGDKVHGGTISGSVTIVSPYIATIAAQATTGGTLTLRSNAADLTTGVVSIPMTVASSNSTTGALTVAGGVGVAGNLNVGGNIVVTGNLTVNGTTTTTNSTTVTIDDPVFTLGGDTAPGSDDNKDRGIEFRWHNGTSARVGFFGYDDSTGKFTFIPDATNTTEVFSGTKGFLDAFLSASDLSGGTIPSAILGNSSIYLGTTALLLNQGSGTVTTLAGMTSITSTSFVGALTGNASTATTLQTTRAINGVNFDGSAAITVPINVTDDTSTSATYYPAFAQATSGNTAPKVSSTKLTFNPSTGVLTAIGFAGQATNLTSIPAGQLTGTIPTAVLGSSTLYVGTTAIALNRASLAQALTGITSIDGSAATLTTNRAINGVNFNGSADITVPVNVTQDNATNATYYPVFAVDATTGNHAARVSSTKLTFNPSTGVLAATTFSGSAASLTSVPAGQLTGTIPSAVLGNSTVNIGTTAIALNRASAAQSLTGITSIDGSAATLTTARAINGVDFNGSAAITVPINVTDDTTTNATYYPALAQATSGNTSPKVSSSKLTFNPSTGRLTATTFTGSFIQSTGSSVAWGTTNGTSTGAINAVMGTSTSATWLISGTSAGTFRGGIQLLDTGSAVMRIYVGSSFLSIDASGNAIVNGTVQHNGLVMTTAAAGAIDIDEKYTFTMTSTALSTAWADTGMSGATQLNTGVYMLYLQAGTNEFYTGTVPWSSGNGSATLNDDFTEIPLMKTGDGGTATSIFVRILRTASAAPKLQISSSSGFLTTYAYVFNFRRIW
jgi:hypothetical protein